MKLIILKVVFLISTLNCLGQIDYASFVFKGDTFKVLPKKYNHFCFENITRVCRELDTILNGNFIQILDSSTFRTFELSKSYYHGEFKMFFEGELTNSGYYHEGKRIGTWKLFKKGKVIELFHYENGRVFQAEGFYENGNKKYSSSYQTLNNDLEIKIYTDFYSNGNVRQKDLIEIYKKCNVFKQCKKEISNKRVKWHLNGEIKSTGLTINDLKYGVWESFDSTGTKKQEIEYKKGQIQKLTKYEIKKVDGKLHYITLYFNSNNILVKKVIKYFENNWWIENTYDKDGKLKKTIKYANTLDVREAR